MSGEKLPIKHFDLTEADVVKDEVILWEGPTMKLLRTVLPDPKITGSMYAWGKTARLVTEPDFLQAVKNTTGDFFMVDSCSSYPTFPQI